MIMLDFPTGYAEKPETYVEKGFSMRKKFLNHPLIKLILHEMNWMDHQINETKNKIRKSTTLNSNSNSNSFFFSDLFIFNYCWFLLLI